MELSTEEKAAQERNEKLRTFMTTAVELDERHTRIRTDKLKLSDEKRRICREETELRNAERESTIQWIESMHEDMQFNILDTLVEYAESNKILRGLTYTRGAESVGE